MTTATEHAPAQPTTRTYLVIYLALMALLAVTVAAAFIPWHRLPAGHRLGVAVALSIALAKGLLILLYFMHVKYGARTVWVFAAAGFLWLGILFTLTYSDYLTRNHPANVNPKGEPRYLQSAPPTDADRAQPRPREHGTHETTRK